MTIFDRFGVRTRINAAGLVTAGAAACLTGLDAARMDRLPETDGIPTGSPAG